MWVWPRRVATHEVGRCSRSISSSAPRQRRRSTPEWPQSQQPMKPPPQKPRPEGALSRRQLQGTLDYSFPDKVDTSRKRPTKAEKKKERRTKQENWNGMSEPVLYKWETVPVAEVLEEQGSDELLLMSTRRVPGGPARRGSSLVRANMPFRYRTPEEKLAEHNWLMAHAEREVEKVKLEYAKGKWTREPPDKLRQWQRDYIMAELAKERKKEIKESERVETMYEIEKRYSRRVQGLPESDEEEEAPSWRSPEILRELRRKKPKKVFPPPFDSLWVKRPRVIHTLYQEEMGQDIRVEDERPEEEEWNFSKTNEEKLDAQVDRRFERFQRYVDKLVPRFEEPNTGEQPSPSQLQTVENTTTKTQIVQSSTANTQITAMKPTYEVPPLIPGRGTVIVSSLSEILNDGSWDENKEATLEKFKYAKLLPYHVCEVLKRVKDWRVALQFFTWVKSVPLFKHDTLNYSIMIRILGSCGNHTQGRKLFDEMRDQGLALNLMTVNNMIKCYGSANRVDDALDLYNELPSYGFEPDVCTYALLIDLLGRAGRMTDVRQLFFDLQAKSLKPDEYVFNSMIANFSRWKELRLAREAFDYMKVCGIRPSTVTYAIVLNMYAKSLSFFLAEKTYYEYLRSDLPPDLYVYNNAILYLGLAGRCREAEWAVEDIEKAGLVPDNFSYCTIISAWARQGSAFDAKKWFDRARSRGIKPSPEMCNALIDAYIKAVDLKRVGEVLDAMPGWGVKCTLQTYTYLFNYYSECSKEFVETLRSFMRKSGHPADAFLDQIFASQLPLRQLRPVSQRFFDCIRLEKSGWASKFADAVVHYLHTYGYVDEAHEVFKAAAATRLFKRNLWENSNDHWFLWLVDMEEGTALVGLKQGLLICREKLSVSQPSKVTIVTGYNKHRKTRTALAVRSALKALESPFRSDLDLARLECRGDLFLDWLVGDGVELDIPFNHPGYVYPPNVRVCFRMDV